MNIHENLQAYFTDFSGEDAVIRDGIIETESQSPVGKVLNYARAQLGVAYKLHVQPDEIGQYQDCSSLTQGAFNFSLGLSDRDRSSQFARTTINQGIYWGRRLDPDEPIRLGDLIFYRGNSGYFNDEAGFPDGIGHVVIYSGNGKAIHAENDVGKVVEQDLAEILRTKKKIVSRNRIIENRNYFHEGQPKPLWDVSLTK